MDEYTIQHSYLLTCAFHTKRRGAVLVQVNPDVPAQDAALVQASQRAHLNHVVMLSSLGAELGGIGGGRPHMPGEQPLQDSGIPWTILHPNEFMTNTLWWSESIRSKGAIFVPTGTGRVGSLRSIVYKDV